MRYVRTFRRSSAGPSAEDGAWRRVAESVQGTTEDGARSTESRNGRAPHRLVSAAAERTSERERIKERAKGIQLAGRGGREEGRKQGPR
jgi:hypothetical protein